MYKKMVVLLDGSKLAELVFDYAQELAARTGVELELLHVCPSRDCDDLPMRRAYIEHMAEIVRARAEELRSKYGKEGADTPVQARATVLVGDPADEILRYVEENDVDLIMMATHGASGVKLWGLGGVAYKIVHAAKVPIWLVPSELREEIILDTMARCSIVVPLSADDNSKAAVPHAVELAERRGKTCELVLVHVVEPPTMAVSREELERFEARQRDMKAYLEEVALPLRERGLTVRTEVLVGEPAQAIIEYLKANPAQLLVMATRPKTLLSRLIFDSVTENIIHLVKKTPLLLVGD
ncbi:MAG: universal stress protein [Thermoleophilia bacterium]|nr:universal stress protein [Thermoleophilia bacterium]